MYESKQFIFKSEAEPVVTKFSPFPKVITITAHEVEIITLFATGSRAREIADKLNCSARTVESIMYKIKKKFKATSVAHVVYLSIKYKIID